MKSHERGVGILLLCLLCLAVTVLLFVVPVAIGAAVLAREKARVAALAQFGSGANPDAAVSGLPAERRNAAVALPDASEPHDVDIKALNDRGLVYVPELARAGAKFPYFDNAALYQLRKVLAEYPMPVTYAYRPRSEQERLWRARARNPNPVAIPGTSPHEEGFAIDTPARSISYDALLRKRQVFTHYGAHWAGRYEGGQLRGDPPHFAWSPVRYGYRTRLEAIRLNAERYRRLAGGG